ncbi:MAG TPA: PH domain-containing protein [Steroidobacteraceae bacterium]
MIALNSWQRLPGKAIWFGVITRLVFAMVLIAVASIFQSAGNAGTLKCGGSACGSMSGGLVVGFLYLYAIFLVGSGVLYYQTFAFLLTNKTLTTVGGYFFQSSSTFRFDKIQDIDTLRGPVHALLGLKTVAIWTASPDQFARKNKRPDARILLDADDADWLRDHLSNQPASSGGDVGVAAQQAAPRASAGLVLVACAAAVLAVIGTTVWKHTMVTRPESAPAAATAAHVAMPAPRQPARMQSAPKQQPAPAPAATSTQELAAKYATACAIHGTGGIDSVIPCAKFGEAQRCQRESDFPSKPTAEPAVLTLANHSNEEVKLYWLNPSGARALYASLPPGVQVNQQSRIGARWLVSTKDDHCIAIFNAATTSIGFF